MVPASAKQRHKSIMTCAVGHDGFAALMDITADEQGDFEPQQRGFVVPDFPAFPRPLHGDEGGGPTMPVGEHMSQRMHLRLTIHDGATFWCPRRDFHVGRQPHSDNAGKRVIDTPSERPAYRNRLLTYFQKRLTMRLFGYIF